MAEALPAADAGLLAAQAKSGMEGVKAYQQAQATLQQQRQGAVSTAMQEAALRGAPVGAMESQQSIISAPYDQRMASLAQGQAGFEADMAARDRRMTDYNAAIGSARTLIPGEVEKIVAPIRAQGEATIANTTRQGEMAVSEIDANTRLALAKMRAAAEAAARARAAASAKANKLSGTDLQAMLSQGTAAKMQGSLGNLAQLLAENKGRTGVDSDVVKNVNAADKALVDEKRKQIGGIPTDQAATNLKAVAANPILAKMMPAAYLNALTGAAGQQYNKDVTAWYAKQPQPQQQQPLSTNPMDPRTLFARPPSVSPTISGRTTIPINASGKIIPGSPGAPAWTARARAGAMTVNPSAAKTSASGKVMGGAPVSGLDYLNSAKQAAALALGRQRNDAAMAPLINAQTGAQDALKAERGKYQSQFGDIGADQLKFIAGSDPYLAGLIQNSPEKINMGNIGRLLAGEPDDSGQVDPYSLDAVRAAQEMVAAQLSKQGYEISPQDFQNAVGNDMKPGETLAQYAMRSTGQLSPEKLASEQRKTFGDKVEYNKLADQYDSEGRALTDENGVPRNLTGEQRSKAYNDMATKWITGKAQMPMPTGGQFGSEQDLMDILQAGGNGNSYPAVDAYHALAANAGGIGFNTKDWQDQVKKLKEKGVNLNTAQLAVLKSLLYVPSLDSKS